LLLATGIRNLRQPNPQGLNDALIGSLLPEPVRSVFVADTPTCPKWYYAANPTDGYLLIDGTATLAQAIGIVDGYIGGLFDSKTQPDNVYFFNAAKEIMDNLDSRGMIPPLGMTVAGHSLGGAICGYWMRRVNLIKRLGVSSFTHTFGAPRPCGSDGRILIQGQGETIRWMNDNDPVPLVPPRIEDAPIILPLFGVTGCIRAANFVHVAGGVDIGPAGNLTDAVLPVHASANFTADLAQWLMTWDNGGQPAHAAQEYVDRLTLAVQLLTPQNRPQVAPAEQPVGHGAQAINEAERRVVNTILHLERQQNATPVVIPPQFLFRAVRISRLWTVVLDKSVVCTPGSKRAARAIARLGNDWIRRLQRTAVVDTAALGAGFQRYLAAATDAAAGFEPEMNDVFPTD
jgi:hypothetical protein